MNWFREFQEIKREQLKVEKEQLVVLLQIRSMLEVGAVVKKRKGQTWKK